MLNRIEIRNFKRIQDNPEGTEKPMILNDLSQVNYLVGKNGSGKSSVLEAIHISWQVANIKNLFGDGFKYFQQLENTFGLSYVDKKTYIKFENDDRLEVNFSFGPFRRERNSEENPFTDLFYNAENNKNQLHDLGNFFELSKTELTYITGNIKWISPNIFDYLISNPVYTTSKNGLEFSDDSKTNKLNIIPARNKIFSGLYGIFRIVYKSIGLGKNEASYDGFNWLGGKDKILKIRNDILLKYKVRDIDKLDNEGKYLYINNDHFSSGEAALYEIINFSMLYNQGVTKDKIVLIDEPEVHLHPKLQKILPLILTEISLKLNIQFIISTHSNYLISAALEQNQELGEDLNRVYLLEDGQNTQPDGGSIDFSHFDNALSNLGVQPSDLLFANGVIWVEGPSDAIYIEHWLNLFSKDKEYKPKKGRDYTFQMLNLFSLNNTGLSNFWDDDQSNSEVINILDVNRKFVVIIDNDEDFDRYYNPVMVNGIYKNKNKIEFLQKIKQRKGDLESTFTGIRDGKMDYWLSSSVYSIENYLYKLVSSNENTWINKPITPKNINPRRSKLKTIFRFSNSNLNSKLKGEFNDSKAFYAKEVCRKFTEFDNFSSGSDELSTKIEALYNTIKSWNQN